MGQLKNFSPKRVSSLLECAQFFGRIQEKFLTYNDKYQLDRFLCFLEIAKNWAASDERGQIEKMGLSKKDMPEIINYVTAVIAREEISSMAEQHEKALALLNGLQHIGA